MRLANSLVTFIILLGAFIGAIPFILLGSTFEEWQDHVIWTELHSGNYSGISVFFFLAIIISAGLLIGGNVLHKKLMEKSKPWDGSVVG